MNIEKYLISEKATIRECMEIMGTSNRIIFITGKERKLLGCLTDGDVRRWILSGKSLDETAAKAMNPSPKYVLQGEEMTARRLIDEYELLAIPVLSQEHKIIDIVFWNEKKNKQQTEKIDTPVVIMAGGKGKRLLPYTSIVPKPLIPIGEKPILERIIDSFYQFGCKEFFLTLNYKKNMIKAYFEDVQDDYTVHYIEEDKPLGTGGSLYYVRSDLHQTFFVSNCDILLDIDYADLLRFHKESGNIITVVTSLKRYVIPYGTVKLDAAGRIEALTEKPATDYLVNTGVYVVEPEALGYIKKDQAIHLTDLIELCLYDGKNVGTYPVSEEAWMDMGQFEDMEKMKRRLE